MKERRRRERNAPRAAHMKMINLRAKYVRLQKQEAKRFGKRVQQKQDWVARVEAKRTKRREPYKKGMVTMKRAGLLLERLEKTHKFNVVKEIVDLYQKANGIEDLERRLKLQTRIATGLLDYCFPRLKAMELKNTDEKPTIINIQVPSADVGTDQIKAQREAAAKKRAAIAMADDWDEDEVENNVS